VTSASTNSPPEISRRTTLTHVGAAVAALGLSSRVGYAAAQETSPDTLANHPIVGVWNVSTPSGPSLAIFFADGSNIQRLPATQAGPQGVTFVGPQVGAWEPTGPRSIHFTGVQLHSDANGVFTGTVTIDGYPEVSEDGQTLVDDQSQVPITIRDAAGVIVQEVPGAGAPPVTGIRMGVGAPGFPQNPGAATPTP
jgi:hypothetical protein